jgi:hypothetical protein
MTIHNKKTNLTCLSCLKSGGCVAIDTFFENDNLVVLIKCNCGGVSKYEFRAWGAKYVSGQRKKLYRGEEINHAN